MRMPLLELVVREVQMEPEGKVEEAVEVIMAIPVQVVEAVLVMAVEAVAVALPPVVALAGVLVARAIKAL